MAVASEIKDSRIKAKTDNLPSDPADASVVAGEITTSETNIRGADSDTLKTISDQIDGISTSQNPVPTADSANNAFVQDVVGNKTDTVAGNSLVALSKQIKAKTDNLPSDPADASVVAGQITTAETNIRGADSDTLKTLSDQIDGLTPGNNPYTIPVPANDSSDNVYIQDVVGSKDDTAASGSSLVSLSKYIKALNISALVPSAADSSGASLYIGDVIGNKDDTVSGDTIVSRIKQVKASTDAALPVTTVDNTGANSWINEVIGNKDDTVDGNSLISLSKQILATESVNTSAENKATYTYPEGTTEETVWELTTTARKTIQGFWLDLFNITQIATIRLYYKIDGTNYRLIDSFDFNPATDSDGFFMDLNMGITDDIKVTYQAGVTEGATRDIYYSVIWDVRE